jgi:hypothetical protein
MTRPIYNAVPADYVSVSHHHCAQCGGNLIRTPRRPIDHIWSLFVPVLRYRCNRFACQWTGNVRADNRAASSLPVTPR